jgi:hypothetical protein
MTRRQILGSVFSATGAALTFPRLSAQASRSQRPEKLPVAYKIAEAYEVYSAMLTQEWLRDRKIKLFVICIKALPFELCSQMYGESEESLRSAIADYTELIKSNWLLQPAFRLERPYKLLPQETLSKAFAVKPEGNPLYMPYQDSGGRYFVFSPVGFNQDKTMAVLHMGYACGSLCGAGQFYVLQKKSGNWTLSRWKSPCSWVS